MKYKGKVKWFNAEKGYGFISSKDLKKDVFIHISALKEAGLNDLNENEALEFELAEEKGKSSAVNISTI